MVPSPLRCTANHLQGLQPIGDNNPNDGSFDRPHTVVVMGVAGSGKTTIGTLLAEQLGWRFADADSFHPPVKHRKDGGRAYRSTMQIENRGWNQCGVN